MTVTFATATNTTSRTTVPARKPRVLAITSELPWPLNTGGHLRTFHLMKALAKRFDVRLIAGVDEPNDPGIDVLRANGIDVRPAVNGARGKLGEVARMTSAALRSEPYVMFHRHNRPAVRSAIAEAVGWDQRSAGPPNNDVPQAGEKNRWAGAALVPPYAQPDVVYLDHVDPFAFRPLFPNATIITDLHNVYSKLTARVADERRGPAQWYLRREARLLADVERRIAQQSAALMTVSAEEQAEFAALGNRNVHLVPNGVDCSAYAHLPVGRCCRVAPQLGADSRSESATNGPTLLYLGALSWQPNAKAAEFLAREVISVVRQQHPNAVLKLVGRNPGPEVLALGDLPGVEVHANVPDVGVYLAEATLLTVALDSGGGTRLKILEAFAAGLPVVSTPVGCEGIDCQHGCELWIADRDKFAQATLDALAAPQLAAEFAERGRQLALAQYDWTAIGERACAAVESILECSGSTEPSDLAALR